MIRHIYDLPYDKMLEGNTADDTASYSTNEDLIFHIGVFTAADKYDVASLRPLVVKKFEDLMETTWESEQFATAVQKLTGPSAGHLADNTLQTAAAAFCAKNLTKLIKKETFVSMIQEEEPFTGRLLTDFLAGKSLDVLQLSTCLRTDCRATNTRTASKIYLNYSCMHCGCSLTSEVYDNMTGTYRTGLGLTVFKKAYIFDV